MGFTWSTESNKGIVAAGVCGNSAAAEAGIGILRSGGNAADAAAATVLALCVTDFGLCSIGGEVPVLVFDATTRKVKALSGQGRAPLDSKSIDWFLQKGIPPQCRGDIKSAAVPSVVDTCLTLLRLYGTLSLRKVAEPTLRLLTSTVRPWHPRLATTLNRLIEEENSQGTSREEGLQAASDRFYGRSQSRNDIAEELEAFYIRGNGFLRMTDLAAHSTRLEDPVTINYRGYTVCKCGPWTQGPALLQALRLLEDTDFAKVGRLSADYIHLVAESLKLALADRDGYYGDPDFVEVPLAQLLSDEYSRMRRSLIDMQRASCEARPGDPIRMAAIKGHGILRPGGDGTTTCVVADQWGNVVAATPSANAHWNPEGGGTGVVHGNRLCSFNTNPGHPNCIAAGKRPRITLTPTIVIKDDMPVMAVSVAGGDMQDQVTLNLLLDIIEFGKSPAEAVSAPRFATTLHQDSFDPSPDRKSTFRGAGSLWLDNGISSDIAENLRSRGHRVNCASLPVAPALLHIDSKTLLRRAAADPSRSFAIGTDV
ncbi:MAG TPA: gamma-glutamyltransferase [Blastocatellia bacterium]|nr:gamma-glutamyltransferase [Blastocatellia bacterium]